MKPYKNSVWYTIEILKPDGWTDLGIEDTQLRYIKPELCMENCFGYKAAIIKHTTSATILATKDFRDPNKP